MGLRGCDVSVQTYAYNNAKLFAAGAPQSALDFSTGIRRQRYYLLPADDDATLYLFYLIVQKYGWSWMDKYMAISRTSSRPSRRGAQRRLRREYRDL